MTKSILLLAVCLWGNLAGADASYWRCAQYCGQSPFQFKAVGTGSSRVNAEFDLSKSCQQLHGLLSCHIVSDAALDNLSCVVTTYNCSLKGQIFQANGCQTTITSSVGKALRACAAKAHSTLGTDGVVAGLSNTSHYIKCRDSQSDDGCPDLFDLIDGF